MWSKSADGARATPGGQITAVGGEGQYPAHSQIAISGSGATALKPVSDPELDDGLAGNP